MHSVNTLPHHRPPTHPAYITGTLVSHGTLRRSHHDMDSTLPRSLSRGADNAQYYYGWHLLQHSSPSPSPSPALSNISSTMGHPPSGRGILVNTSSANPATSTIYTGTSSLSSSSMSAPSTARIASLSSSSTAATASAASPTLSSNNFDQSTLVSQTNRTYCF